MRVPFVDLQAQHAPIKGEILALWGEILDTGGFVGGTHVDAFEREFATACGVQHAVAVASGTDALRFALMAKGLRAGDEVILPANTFIATAEAITQAGGVPVFVDIEPDTYTLAVQSVTTAITPRTRGIVAVHLYGQIGDIDALQGLARHHGLWLIEDAAQAHLAERDGKCAGSLGDAAGFSFYPSKNLGACGEAGAVTTNDAGVADHVRILRDHGQALKYVHSVEGYNGRCDAVQAAALRVKLRHLPQWTAQRRERARRYIDTLRGVKGIMLPRVSRACQPVWHLFVVQVENRDAVQAALAAQGIGTAVHYPIPLHLQPAYAHLGLREGSLPIAEAAAKRILSLPMFETITEEQVAYVCAHLTDLVAR